MKAAGLALALSLPVLGHSHLMTEQGVPYFQRDYGNVEMLYNEDIRAGATNASGKTMITANSNPVAALRAAAETWGSVLESRVRFAPLASTTSRNDPSDLRSVMVMIDTPEIRSVVGDALAVTLAITVPTTGEVIDADIFFSPSVSDQGMPFSTTGAANTWDLQAVATHEMGHVLGMGHSHLMAAVLFPFSGTTVARTLSPDDMAYVREVAPVVGTQGRYGELRGTLTLPNGQPARGVALTASDATSGETVGALTDTTGGYAIRSVIPGNYVVFAEPLDGPAFPRNFQLRAGADTNFEATYFGAKQLVPVNAGGRAEASFTLPPRNGSVNITFYASGRSGGAGDFGEFGAVRAVAGSSLDFLVAGDGLGATVTAQEIELIGGAAAIRPGSVRLDTRLIFTDGTNPLRFTVDLADSSHRSIVSLVVRHGGGMSTIPGGLIVTPTQGAILGLTSGSIVNAATAAVGAVAPNSWVSIFGKNLARQFILGPETLITQIDGTSVSITDSRGAVQLGRLQFVSPEQINFLMPAVVAPGTARLTVTGLLGAGSADIQVAAVAPGIFTANADGRGAAAATYLTVLPSGAQQSGFTFAADRTPRENVEVDLGAAGTQVYLTFYGTGLRAHASPVTATIGGIDVPVLAAVAQGQFAGLDQINVGPLPATLAGRGVVTVLFQMDGRTTNAVTVSLR